MQKNEKDKLKCEKSFKKINTAYHILIESLEKIV